VPKVDSAVVTIVPRREPLPDAVLQRAEQVTRAAFMQRRKKLRNSVRQFFDARGLSEAQSPIDLDRRADSLAPREFVRLAEFLLADGTSQPLDSEE
jgi:16S rRNA (adenine1518-N6/adenine1519-N6)-dimethyltransferase